jgi:hypothetical protein
LTLIPRATLPLVALAVLFPPSNAWAHRPYEIIDRVHEEGGRQFALVKSYIDGILAVDPVKLVIRANPGNVTDESDYHRDVLVACPFNQCAAFSYHDWFTFLPTDVWSLSNGRLERDGSPLLWTLGTFLPLWDHVLGYFAAIGALLLPAWFAIRSWRRSGRTARIVVAVLTLVASLPFLVLWSVIAIVNTRLSVIWISLLSLLVSLGVRQYRRRIVARPLRVDG